ncbi:hypothetical protein BS78_06G007000 [Paspalum vaginatum]|nr:hypothetical protein BS78_06G007000 [Paspalum vaginatum]
MTTLAFAVRRREPELVGPAAATPRETKRLSDIDDREGLRVHVPSMFFYRGGPPQKAADDSAAVIRCALGETLVPYYPLAGRLREAEAGKLVVDCTGEGVLFVEDDADVRLADLEAAASGPIRPPFPCTDQLLFDVEGSGGVLNCPLLLIQVTRLLCGGFVFALRLNHTICDAAGIVQFLTAVAELSRGLPAPTITPTWSRELLSSACGSNGSGPPAEPAYDDDDSDVPAVPLPPPGPGDDMMAMRTFTFYPADVSAMKKELPLRLRNTATTFDVLAACLWRTRTAALETPPGEETRLVFAADFRGVRELDPQLPTGYYGNACVPVEVLATAGTPLGDMVGGGDGAGGEAGRHDTPSTCRPCSASS